MMLGDRVAVMRAGVLEQVAKPMDIYGHPANLFVAGFIGSPPMNFFTGRLPPDASALIFENHTGGNASPVSDAKLALVEGSVGRLKAYAGKAVVLGFRPEHVILKTAWADAPPELTVAATVQSIETTGADAFLHTNWNGRPLVVRVPAGERRTPGEQVQLVFDMRKAHFFDPETEQALLSP
jgi:multiple sugar transport system ATP-binding protein